MVTYIARICIAAANTSPCGRVKVVWFDQRTNTNHDSVANNITRDTNVQKSDLLGCDSMSFNVLPSICA